MNWYFFSSEKVADIFECIEWNPEGGVGQAYPVLMTLRYVPEGVQTNPPGNALFYAEQCLR